MSLAPHHVDACHQVAELSTAQLKLHGSCPFSSPFPSSLPGSFEIFYGSPALGFSFLNSVLSFVMPSPQDFQRDHPGADSPECKHKGSLFKPRQQLQEALSLVSKGFIKTKTTEQGKGYQFKADWSGCLEKLGQFPKVNLWQDTCP